MIHSSATRLSLLHYWVLLLICLFSQTLQATGLYEAGREKSAVCASCHGLTGVSTNPAWPNLAGQHSTYLVKQLRNLQPGGGRISPIMTPLVATLTTQDIDDLSAFYASQPIPKGATPEQFLARGEALYRGGDFTQHITACIACHSPKGTGNQPAGFPVLSGQHALYTIQQLQAFKDKTRHTDLNAIMQDISGRMTSADIEAVAHYVEGLY